MKRFNYLTMSLLVSLLCLAGCGDNNSTSAVANSSSLEASQSYFIDNDKKNHYLDFINDLTQVAQMVVFKDDTYEELVPYFPVLPAEEIINGLTYRLFWELDVYFVTELDGKAVYTIYSDSQLEINVYAQRELQE